MPCFHSFDNAFADQDGFCDYLRNVPWEDILNSVLLLLLVNYEGGFRLELMYISLIVSIRSNLTHFYGFQLPVLLPYIVHRNHFFRLYQQKKSSESKVKFRQTSCHCKRVLEAAKLAYAIKSKEIITSQKLGSWDFQGIANSLLNKGKSAIPPLFNNTEVLSFTSDIAKLFAKNFFKNWNLFCCFPLQN